MKPLKLKMTNFLSHRKSELDFTKLSPVTLLIGEIDGNRKKSNGSGKSSICDGISFCLFGECRATGSKNVSIESVISRGQDEAEVEFTFDIDGVQYNIVRTRSRSKRSGRVDFSVWTGSKWKSVGDRKKDTQREILKVVGIDYEIFINSVFFKQGEVSAFAEMTSGERREVIKRLLQIEKYELCSKIAKDKLSQLSVSISAEEAYLEANQNLDESILRINGEIDKINTLISTYEQSKQLSEAKIQKLKDKIAKESEQVTVRRRVKEDVERLKSQQQALNNEIKDLNQNKKIDQKQLDTCTITRQQLVEQLDKLIAETPDRHNLKLRMEEAKQQYVALNSKVDELRQQKAILESKMNEIKTNASSIQKLGEGRCPTCFADVTTKSKDQVKAHLKQEYQLLKPDFESKTTLLEEEEKKLQALNKQIEGIREEGNVFNRNVQEKKSINEKIEIQNTLGVQTNARVARTDKTIDEKAKQLTQVLTELSQKETELNGLKDVDLDSHQQLQIEIGTEQAAVERFTRQINDTNISKGSLNRQLEDLTQRKIEVGKIKGKLQGALNEKRVLTELIKIFGKSGIQSLILENSAIEIEEITNELLKEFTNGNVSITIKTLKKNKDETTQEVFDIEIQDESGTGLFETFSGGEKFRVAFAIRIALSMMLMKKSGVEIPFILYDEAFSDLDEEGVTRLVDIFENLKKHFAYQLVITHTTELKDKFESVLLIQKDSNGSRITQ